jgi:hypothetical protein
MSSGVEINSIFEEGLCGRSVGARLQGRSGGKGQAIGRGRRQKGPATVRGRNWDRGLCITGWVCFLTSVGDKPIATGSALDWDVRRGNWILLAIESSLLSLARKIQQVFP